MSRELVHELRLIAWGVRELEIENATLRAQLDQCHETLRECREALQQALLDAIANKGETNE